LSPSDLAIALTDEVDEALRVRILAGLEASHPDSLGALEPEPLALLLHDPAGRLVGGLIGRSFWGWLLIELLWIDAAHRGSGHGRRLMASAEEEGRRRGCHHARVDTFSFQAPQFYEKCGYARVGTLDDFPTGHQRHFYAKPLV
jgi:GNAT superfamily N-acetyltransferase